jgi:hypothetical protein
MSESQQKSGYQLRAELLTLARDIVETNIHMARENRDTTRPRYFSTEDVILEAEKLYTFVQKNS